MTAGGDKRMISEDGGEVVQLHKYAAKTPEARARQRANLTPAAAVQHGAYSADRLQPERERVLGELLASFPGVRRDRLEIAASQRARITLLTAYVEARGIIAHRGRGSTYPAVTLLQREESAYRAELTRIEELHVATGSGAGSLAAIETEYAAVEDGS
jgi:hypothetical protein